MIKSARQFASGDRIVISNPDRGSCIGKIEDIRQPDELPDLADLKLTGNGEDARAILREWGVTRIAMISYMQTPGNSLMFAALEIDGEWYDLQRQKLTIRRFGWTH